MRNPVLLRRVWNLCLTSFQRLFLCGRSLLRNVELQPAPWGPPGSSRSPVPKNGTAFDFWRPMDPPNESHSNWENFCANFGMTFHFLCNFWSCKLQQVAKKAQLRVVCSGPSNTEQMNPYHFCDFLPKSSNPKPSSNGQHDDTMYDVC